MAAGIIDHESGTRDMRRLNGMCRSCPITAMLAMVAAAAMAGVPLLNGFLCKEMFFAEAVQLAGADRLGLSCCRWRPSPAALFSVAYSLRFIHDVFFNGEPADLPRTPHEPPRWMRMPVGDAGRRSAWWSGFLPEFTVGAAAGGSLGATVRRRAAAGLFSWRSGMASTCRWR